MIHLKQRKAILRFLRRLMASSVVCLCCRKVNTNLGDERLRTKDKTYKWKNYYKERDLK